MPGAIDRSADTGRSERVDVAVHPYQRLSHGSAGDRYPLGPDARPIIVSDGLGVSTDQWQIGDLIVQRHRFALPQDIPADTYWLQTGAYWLDTLERLLVQNSTLQADRLLLTAIEVKP